MGRLDGILVGGSVWQVDGALVGAGRKVGNLDGIDEGVHEGLLDGVLEGGSVGCELG